MGRDGDMRERGVKDNFEVWGLNNWKDKIVIDWDGDDVGVIRLGWRLRV